MHYSETQDKTAQSSTAGAAVRLYWMLVGNAAAFLVAASEIRDPVHLLWKDALFVLLVASLPLARWIGMRRFGGTTADGEPMTPKHLKSYTMGVIAAFGAIWGLFHLLRVFFPI
jgi:hypothetical protein